jgi:acyl-CoA reductase-like NAD-dependent aldehyde dehydrogenase
MREDLRQPATRSANGPAGRVPVYNPYSGEVVGEVPLCGPDEVDAACRTAAAALARGDFQQHQRALVLDAAAVVLTGRRDELAAIITAESGKAIKDARTEVLRAAETFRFAAAEARKLCGELVPLEATATGVGKLGLALRLPIGVVGAITPFNFPLNTVAHKLAPAIAAGCPVVLKPAPQTPLTAIRLVTLLVEVGLPADWITVVTDTESEAGAALVEHPIPKLLTFTGSPAVGWGIAAKAPRKHVALELGSNAPVLVEPDVPLAPVAERIVRAACSTAGQSCISVQRVLVDRSVHEELVERLTEAAERLVVGDPADEATDVGPLITGEATERVLSWVEEARDGGGRVLTGGELAGRCVRPTIVDEPAPGSKLRLREIFGPVLAVIPYDGFDQAIEIANETPFGLQAGLFTNDLGKAMRAVRELEFGGVLVNEIPTFRADQQPYGGVGDSGNSREGPASVVLAMTEVRFVSIESTPVDPVPPRPGS